MNLSLVFCCSPFACCLICCLYLSCHHSCNFVVASFSATQILMSFSDAKMKISCGRWHWLWVGIIRAVATHAKICKRNELNRKKRRIENMLRKKSALSIKTNALIWRDFCFVWSAQLRFTSSPYDVRQYNWTREIHKSHVDKAVFCRHVGSIWPKLLRGSNAQSSFIINIKLFRLNLFKTHGTFFRRNGRSFGVLSAGRYRQPTLQKHIELLEFMALWMLQKSTGQKFSIDFIMKMVLSLSVWQRDNQCSSFALCTSSCSRTIERTHVVACLLFCWKRCPDIFDSIFLRLFVLLPVKLVHLNIAWCLRMLWILFRAIKRSSQSFVFKS